LEVTSTPAPACTAACTGEAKNNEIDPDLARLVEVWPNLPEGIRRGILATAESAIPSRR
jgi:hypothetical protein